MLKVNFYTIDEDSSGQRVDNYLLRICKGVPKSHVYKLLRTGQVRVNKKRKKPVYRLQAGDLVRVPPVRQGEIKSQVLDAYLSTILNNSILYEDDHLLVLNKPTRVAVHGGSGISSGVIETMRQLRPPNRYLELVHRLDKHTSGCLLLAKKRSALRMLHQSLRASKMVKKYLALLSGRMPKGKITCDEPLLSNTLISGERMVRVDELGKPAISIFTPREYFGDSTLVEVEIITGRTHQIRVHAEHQGYPVIGDQKYGDKIINNQYRERGLRRMFLHASSVRIPHPAEHRMMNFNAPLDENLNRLLNELRAGHNNV